MLKQSVKYLIRPLAFLSKRLHIGFKGNQKYMTTKLARQLRAARLRMGFTLRDVEKKSGKKITNAYLSQLEHGAHADPSPKKLRAICDVLKLSYIDIMIAAGYLNQQELRAFSLTGLRMVECRK